MLLNTPQNVWATCCARIPNVTWVQLCSRLQQAAKRRVDQYPAVTAVPEKPRAPIIVVMCFASNDSVLVYVQAVHLNRYFMTIRSSPAAVCVRSSFVPA